MTERLGPNTNIETRSAKEFLAAESATLQDLCQKAELAGDKREARICKTRQMLTVALSKIVNTDSRLNRDQQEHISGAIAHLGTKYDKSDEYKRQDICFEDLTPVATFINSCKG